MDLTSLRLPDLKVSEAVAVPAASIGPIRVPHCRMTGVIGTEIRFSLLLPDDWNQKFFVQRVGQHQRREEFFVPTLN